MKVKKYIIFSTCIALIGCFAGIKLLSSKNNDNNKVSTVIKNNAKDRSTSAETNSTNAAGNTKETANSTLPSIEASKLDITMIDTTPNVDGNTSENLANGGYFAKQGKWIYFTMPPANSKSHPIYRAMSDGETGLKAITKEGFFRCINVAGEWVYYLGGDAGSYIYRTKTDGSLTEKVVENPVLNMFIKDDFIYYSSYNGITKLKLNSSKEDKGTLLVEGSNYNYFYVTNSLIYVLLGNMNVTDSSTGKGEYISNLYTMNLNGTNQKKITNDSMYTFTINNNYIFYITTANQKLFRMNLNGSNKIQLFSSSVSNYNIYNNNIYFSENGDYYSDIYKSDLNGKEIVRITNNAADYNQKLTYINYIFSLSLIDENIFYFGYSNSDLNLYRIKLDGSLNRILY